MDDPTKNLSLRFKSPALAAMPLLHEADEPDMDIDEEPVVMIRHMSAPSHDFAAVPQQLNSQELFVVTLVYLVNFMDSLGSNISLPTMPFYARRFHASTLDIGYLFSGFSIATTVALLFLSRLSDRYGRRFVMILCLAGTAVGSFGQGFAMSYWMLLAARIFSGIWAGVSSVCQVYIGDIVPGPLRPWYINYLITSGQAALLFGPSIGAGLSVLGLNVPILINGILSAILVPVVWAYLPESPEWLKMQAQAREAVNRKQSGMPDGSKIRRQVRNMEGVGWWGTKWAICIYGAANFAGMAAQSGFASMYAVFASATFGLDSLHVGFIFTLGATTSVAANIWVSPLVQRMIGDAYAGILGSALVLLGAVLLAQPVFCVSLAGTLLLFQGCAMNNAAVSCGASDLTDVQNRSTVLAGVRMCKSFGGVVGPSLAGLAASKSVDLPFVAVGCFAVAGAGVQFAFDRKVEEIRGLVEARRAVAKTNKEVWKEYGHWQPEIGTPDEIRDLGEFMANLLTSRNYRWVTYSQELKSLLTDFFPPLSVASPEDMAQSFLWVRQRANSFKTKAQETF